MRILLCDDHRLMREGLRAVLEKEGQEIVGEAVNGREVVALCRQLQPDIVVMDVSMPDVNGIDATRQLMLEMPDVRVVGLSMNTDRRYLTAMFAAGAVGYLPKSSGADELMLAIRTVASGHEYRSPSVSGATVDSSSGQAPGHAVPKPLSTREREVLQLLAEGKSSKEIAAGLDIGVTTVETHRRQIMDKLGLRTIAELTKYAVKVGLTSLD
jgi:two-component system, NarL family, response regulator NreC